mgnify:CR=1 FL=1
MSKEILVTNIQRFSLHDGPGIRTTVFLKGCSLRCPWCSNPENYEYFPQSYRKDGVEGMCGKYYTPEELINECLKDQPFYGGKLDKWSISKPDQIEILPGGVTFSGGESLLQMKQLVPVCEALHKARVHIAVETSLFIPMDCLQFAIEHIDFFYADMKILNAALCKEVERGDLDIYLNNFDILMNCGKPVVVRIPVIGMYTDGKENRRSVCHLLEKYKEKVLKIELIKEHHLGNSKYLSLGYPLPNYIGVEDNFMEMYKKELSYLGVPVEVCKI